MAFGLPVAVRRGGAGGTSVVAMVMSSPGSGRVSVFSAHTVITRITIDFRNQVGHILTKLRRESGLYIKNVAEQVNLQALRFN